MYRRQVDWQPASGKSRRRIVGYIDPDAVLEDVDCKEQGVCE